MSAAGRPATPRSARVAIVAGRAPEARYSLHRGYVDALVAIGAVPVVLPAGPGVPIESALSVLADCDALLLSGGGDVHPATYAAAETSDALVAACRDLDVERDQVELALLSAARNSGKRVLGICRGAQLLGAALGGTLVVDLPDAGHDGHFREDAEQRPVHAVDPEPNSLVGRLLGGVREVNSIHHQAVGRPGPELRASAYSPDGVVEAVEGEEVLGVQWHPERMAAGDTRHLAAFSWLIGI